MRARASEPVNGRAPTRRRSRDRAGAPGVSVPEGPVLDAGVFARLSGILRREAGLNLAPAKRAMLQNRLQRRLRQLGLTSFEAYLEHLLEAGEPELAHLVDVGTTHKTEFFREPRHFDLLAEEVLPELARRAAPERRIDVWSAGCSTGEEVYTLGMILSDFAESTGVRFSLVGTDVSGDVVRRARLGIYPADRADAVPEALRRRYLMRSRDPLREEVRVVPELRARVRFRQASLFDDDAQERVDVLFCRNVMIYFDRATREEAVRRLVDRLRPGGTLFVGHAEALGALAVDLKMVAPAVYRRVGRRS